MTLYYFENFFYEIENDRTGVMDLFSTKPDYQNLA